MHTNFYVNKVQGKKEVLETFPEVFHSLYSILNSTNVCKNDVYWPGYKSIPWKSAYEL